MDKHAFMYRLQTMYDADELVCEFEAAAPKSRIAMVAMLVIGIFEPGQRVSPL